MGTYAPDVSFDLPPNKRLKTLNPNSEEEDDSDPLTCGICLFDDNGNAIRGQIDSCDHFFCFVCIMEWAKVESSCPICKRRFSSIRRPPDRALFRSERIVNVLQRDQVYLHSGSASIGAFDPYAHTQCSVCRTSKDENFLLLCDLCDSAAHSYCVGLGFTVPEGDWFCHDCAVSKTEHETIQKNEEDVNQDLPIKSNEVKAAISDTLPDVAMSNQYILDNADAVPVNRADVSIFDIVCNSDEPIHACLQARSASSPHKRQPNLSEESNLPAEKTQTGRRKKPQSNSEKKINQNGARTLSRCRNICSYVQALRDNWKALQNGRLRFSSTSTSSTKNGQKVTKNDSLHETSADSRCSYGIDKAWKMLDKAKLVKQESRRTNGVDSVLKNSRLEGSSSNTAAIGSSSLHLSKRQLLASRELQNSSMAEQQFKFCSGEKETHEHISTKWRMQKHSSNMAKAMAGSYDNLPNPPLESPASVSLSMSSRKNQTSSQRNVFHENRETHAKKRLYNAPENVTDKQDRSGRSVTSVMPVPEASKSLNMKAEVSIFSSCRADVSKQDVKIETGSTGSKAGKYEDAKSEIQLLVKLNLKLLDGEKQLGINGFKEVARVGTHTILDACGFGQSRHVFHSVPSFFCSHSDGIQQLRLSLLIVKSVSTAILWEQRF
ncbi:PHD and RING finger domain-containing protein 1 [Euphorbia peplus]|nr:PHD and RING finger domain-containing protein 1 [Euphorbia peplus]